MNNSTIPLSSILFYFILFYISLVPSPLFRLHIVNKPHQTKSSWYIWCIMTMPSSITLLFFFQIVLLLYRFSCNVSKALCKLKWKVKVAPWKKRQKSYSTYACPQKYRKHFKILPSILFMYQYNTTERGTPKAIKCMMHRIVQRLSTKWSVQLSKSSFILLILWFSKSAFCKFTQDCHFAWQFFSPGLVNKFNTFGKLINKQISPHFSLLFLTQHHPNLSSLS